MIAITVNPQLARCGDQVAVRLKAPIYIDHNRVENARIIVTIHTITGSIKEELTLLEEGKDSSYFTNDYTIPHGTSRMEFSYGYGLFEKAAIVHVVDH
ncbi:hypothetical protein D3C78_1744340 [compost metagenome]